MACRALVMKQYKTAVNHLLKIEEVKKDIATTVKKLISHEISNLCKWKDCVLRLSNLFKFSWKAAYKQLKTVCPVTTDILETITGGKEVHMPRIVSSLSILLFTRNQSISTLQAINSVFMFRGHIRTRVRLHNSIYIIFKYNEKPYMYKMYIHINVVKMLRRQHLICQ